MTPEAHQAAIRRESDAFVAAARAGNADARVPACPDWSLRDLVHHVAGVHAFWRGTLEGAMAGKSGPVPDLEQAMPPASELTIEQYEEGVQLLLDRLAEADPSKPMWNWSGSDQTIGWLSRRMAQELAIHRADAEQATGTARPVIEPALAVDGLAELGEIFLPSIANYYTDEDRRKIDIGGTLLLRPEDVADSAWRYVVDGPTNTFGGAPAAAGDSADCLVSGTASDLLLLVWNRARVDEDGFTVSGDASVLTRWRAQPIFD
jgi:uncharacterized protein (TIGR03083 family)